MSRPIYVALRAEINGSDEESSRPSLAHPDHRERARRATHSNVGVPGGTPVETGVGYVARIAIQ